MPNLDPKQALVDLEEEALLPNPVHVRDMIFRTHLDSDQLLQANRKLKEYLKAYGSTQELASSILTILAGAPQK